LRQSLQSVAEGQCLVLSFESRFKGL